MINIDFLPSYINRVNSQKEIEEHHWSLIIVDQRESSAEQIRRLVQQTPVICLDEGGSGAAFASCLLNSLPMLKNPAGGVNQFRPGFLIQDRFKAEGDSDRILVTFGGEDPAGLTLPVVEKLLKCGIEPSRIQVIIGPSFHPVTLPPNIETVQAPASLVPYLTKAGVVFTSFGITAFEAASAGVPVVNINPGTYHQKLSESVGFPTLSVNDKDESFLIMSGVSQAQKAPPDIDFSGPSLPELLSDFQISGPEVCPVCSSSGIAVLRLPERTFFRCPDCGIFFQPLFFQPEGRYKEEYFFREYQEQYGKTYLDDFDHIKKMGHSRLEIIKTMIPPLSRLLDVGCAFGPFLTAAQEEGYIPLGLDISQDAVNYVHRHLGIPAWHDPFDCMSEHVQKVIGKVDVLTMWYVIEHFENLDNVLVRCSHLLRMNGILAFSTPNIRGISGRRKLKNFLANSPTDHFSIWSPQIARRVLRRYGFRIEYIRITGHHPERFSENRLFRRLLKNRWFYRLLVLISSVLGLGDTFEVYGRKMGECHE